MTLEPWWEHWDGLLQTEFDALDAAGIRHELDGNFLSNHGIVKVVVWPRVNGEERRMEAVFPDLYPWFRPEVLSPGDDLPKHQGPFEKNLCLLPRESDAWRIGHDTLAGLLTTQLDKVYESQHSPISHKIEEHQAEPFTAYYDNAGVGALVVDSGWDLGDATHGTFEYGIWKRQILLGEHRHQTTFVGAVLEVRDQDGNTVAEADPVLANRFVEKLTGRWQRRSEPVRKPRGRAAREAVRHEHRHLRNTEYERHGSAGSVEAVGLVFPVEAEYGGATVDAWMFLVSFAPQMQRRDLRSYRRSLHEQGHTQWLPGQRGSRSDLAIRVPRLRPLRGKNVLVVGVGALGAPAAQHLVQSGANVRLVDGDVADAGTSVRFPFGYADAGRSKVQVAAEWLAAHSPLAEVDGDSMRLGAVRLSPRPDAEQHGNLNRLLDGVDLILDATGSHAVGLFLSDCAAMMGVPFVNATTTWGCWGGRVMALRPKDGACFECVYCHIDDRESCDVPDEERLIAPEEPGGEIRPVGCGDATYTGSSFDAAAVVSVTVRAIVSMLCGGEEGAYPPMRWDVATIWNRTPDGAPLAGRTFEFELGRHEDCYECKRRSG